MTTVGQWLKDCGLEYADKHVLFEFAVGMNRVSQMTHPERVLTAQETERLAEVTRRRLSGEPVPYIVGKQEFFGRDFEVNPSVLIPRPDTECLAEWLIEHLPSKACACDLGTGSGCIAATLALERPDLTVLASDISRQALETAQNNASRLGAKVQFFEGSWLDPYPQVLKIDAVISNPPYIRPNDTHLANLTFEPQSALTDYEDGLSAYRNILKAVGQRTFPPKVIAFEHGYDQGGAVRTLFDSAGFIGSQTFKDLGGNPRFTVWTETE